MDGKGKITKELLSLFLDYFREVRGKYLTGDYTEITLRTPLENLVRGLSEDYGLIQEPKRSQEIGAPDFKAFRREFRVGYIETKDLGKNLDRILESEQIARYTNSVDNLILTDYSRFMLLREGRKALDFNLFSLADLDNPKFVIPVHQIEKFIELTKTFFLDWKTPTIRSAKELALALSRKARLLKDLVKEQLEEDLSDTKPIPTSSILDFYEGVKELIRDISVDDCADAYAQTITYGLFLAKVNCPDTLERKDAAFYIPRNVGVIKRIFINISGDSLPSNMSWIIDEITDILNAAVMKTILSEIDARGKRDRDPFTFFYEDFLSAYDPEKRKHLGVYYTPRPVVSFIINSLNLILIHDFGKHLGFAEDDVTVLDPAVGTGTFLWLIYTLALVELKKKSLGGLIKSKIENHILKHFYGLEILITPYIISHLKLSIALKRWFYDLRENDRIQVYLTNTLEPSEIHGLLPFLKEITFESKAASELKLKKKILVITGNPPYRGLSANRGEWIRNLLKKGYSRADGSKDAGYYEVDGEPLEERNPKWLQDDYVKFIRFAQWKVDNTGEGIVGMITNHGYIDNPTFRGMRQSLLRSFNRIYILNLHGNKLKKEKCPDGSKDDNVFDIRQGVAISILVKIPNINDRKVCYADLFGDRDYKYHWLDRHSVMNVEWQEVKPESPDYFFYPIDMSVRKEYDKYWKLTDIFPVRSVGVVTARDRLVLGFSKEQLLNNLKRLSDLDLSDSQVREIFKLKDTGSWRLRDARSSIGSDKSLEESLIEILYRPFDSRWLYYNDCFVERPRKSAMKHILSGQNVCLVYTRSISAGKPYNHAFCVSNGVLGRFYPDSSCITYFSPLFLFKEKKSERSTKTVRTPNINVAFQNKINAVYKKETTPEDIFQYIYAILHSSNYRKKFVDFLKVDFPRIPIVRDYERFKKLSEIGGRLVQLHLMKVKMRTTVAYDIAGSNVVSLIRYKDNNVFINKEQYFSGVPKEVWDFCVGGCQVLDKWLKSRMDRELTSREIEHFLQVVEIIKETLVQIIQIDEKRLV